MNLYKKFVRNPDFKLQGLPTYLIKDSFLQSLRHRGMKINYEDISLPHANQVFVLDEDTEGSLHSSILHVIDHPASTEVESCILLNFYACFINDPDLKYTKAVQATLILQKDEDLSKCKVTVLRSNFDSMKFTGRHSNEVQNTLLQYAFNQILLINHALSYKEIIEGKETRSIKISEDKGKKAYSDVEFRYLSLRSSSIHQSKNINSNIEWNYSWIVRGHWRYFKDGKLGLNRYGIREEIGRTWINEYLKNEGKELDTRPKKIMGAQFR